MKLFKNYLTSFAVSFFLVTTVGCKPKDMSYSYLMQHPKELNQAISFCKKNESSECATVRQASEAYDALNKEREANPELFGQKILAAQEELGHLNQALDQAKTQLAHQANDVAIQKNISLLEKNQAAQVEKVNILLAVVAATSPE